MEEIIQKGFQKEENICTLFSDFVAYFEFLEGDIYDNACYFGYVFSSAEMEKYKINIAKLNFRAFLNKTIRDFSFMMSQEELKEYKAKEKDKVLRRQWIDKLCKCETYEEFRTVLDNLQKSAFYKRQSQELELIFKLLINVNSENVFRFIMEYVSDDRYPTSCIEKGLCLAFEPQKVLASYNYKRGSKSTFDKRKRDIKEQAGLLEKNKLSLIQKSFFDTETHYYCCYISGYAKEKQAPIVYITKYFNTFLELADYLGNDLSGCDLTGAILQDVDFSAYKTDKYTKLPVQNPDELKYVLCKKYDRKEDLFKVEQHWLGVNGQTIKVRKNEFRYFSDFLYFLEDDLSNADLLFCNGLKNLHSTQKINLTNAKLRSEILDAIGIPYQKYYPDMAVINSFLPVVRNEEESAAVLALQREEQFDLDCIGKEKIYYISDLHLLHKLENNSCRTMDDIYYFVQLFIDKMIETIDRSGILLIGGDVSSDFSVFNLFIRTLRHSLDERGLRTKVIFLLGNHELWGFPNISLTEITEKYDFVIKEQGMYLLQNSILYQDNGDIQQITIHDLKTLSRELIREKLRRAKVILFGGLAFSGYNEEFNANCGIYRRTINREEEIEACKEFESLYNIVCNILPDRNVIIFTHTPRKDWMLNEKLHSGYVYINGHTHRNDFYDDGVYRIYADNQIGYRNGNPCLKYFYLDGIYDIFEDYEDGIYEITREQYIDFYHGKKIRMDFKREINQLYMLKKRGYYCFIHESQYGSLSILNGGALRRLDNDEIEYYYNRMDAVIAHIKKPLDKYASLQKQVAHEIKAIGGIGDIHGAIVDIDFYNHIYVNPYDQTITGYWASDMVCKKVYSSIPQLLEANCPQLYSAYVKRLEGKEETVFSIQNKNEGKSEMSFYPNTDIYRASKEIKKMQKLDFKILTVWYELEFQMIESK